MSLRDTFRSLRRGGESDEPEVPDDAPEPGEFRPRSDGVYDGGEDPDHPDFNRYTLLNRLLPVYEEIVRRLAAQSLVPTAYAIPRGRAFVLSTEHGVRRQ